MRRAWLKLSAAIVALIWPASAAGTAAIGMFVRCTTLDKRNPATDWATPR
jgi:hypothetical protein